MSGMVLVWLALVLGTAGVAKAAHPSRVTAAIESWFPRTRGGGARLLGLGLAVFELVVALMLVIPATSRGALVVTVGFLILATVYLAFARALGLETDCGCFGELERSLPTWAPFVRNGVLVSAGAFLLSVGHQAESESQAAWIGGVMMYIVSVTIWRIWAVLAPSSAFDKQVGA